VRLAGLDRRGRHLARLGGAVLRGAVLRSAVLRGPWLHPTGLHPTGLEGRRRHRSRLHGLLRLAHVGGCGVGGGVCPGRLLARPGVTGLAALLSRTAEPAGERRRLERGLARVSAGRLRGELLLPVLRCGLLVGSRLLPAGRLAGAKLTRRRRLARQRPSGLRTVPRTLRPGLPAHCLLGQHLLVQARLRLTVLRLTMLLAVLCLTGLGLIVLGLIVLGLIVLGLSVLRLTVLGLARLRHAGPGGLATEPARLPRQPVLLARQPGRLATEPVLPETARLRARVLRHARLSVALLLTTRLRRPLLRECRLGGRL
jgi:hypothetical protein